MDFFLHDQSRVGKVARMHARSWSCGEPPYHCSGKNFVTLHDITPECRLVWESSRNLPNSSLPGFQLLLMPAATTATITPVRCQKELIQRRELD